MKTRTSVRKDADVLVATSKHVGQFDLPNINPTTNAISNICIRVGNFFKAGVKVEKVNEANQYSQSVVVFESTGDENLSVRAQPNVPDKSVSKENIKVISADGMHVGNVERVFADSAFEQITHLLISKEIPAQERKLIPIKWVRTMGDAAVHLRVTKDLVEELADASIIW